MDGNELNIEQNASFLRWAGSKRKLLPILKKYWSNDYGTYFEPFMGSAQLFYSLPCSKKAIISDINSDLVNTYSQLKKNPYAIYRILKQFKNSKKEYYRVRSLNTQNLGVNQQAARFIFLNWLCFNGLYRTNLKGDFNVPYSGDNKKNIDKWSLLKTASKKLETTRILHGDFEKIIKKNIKKNDFVYLDPPYALENERIFTQYCNHTFGLSDIDRLVDVLKYIDSKGAYFILSYADTPIIRQKVTDYSIVSVEVQRNIAGFAKYRRKSAELLITNIE